jgi:hypothetical protein
MLLEMTKRSRPSPLYQSHQSLEGVGNSLLAVGKSFFNLGVQNLPQEVVVVIKSLENITIPRLDGVLVNGLQPTSEDIG